MAEFSEEDFAQFFSVSRDLFNNCNANDAILWRFSLEFEKADEYEPASLGKHVVLLHTLIH